MFPTDSAQSRERLFQNLFLEFGLLRSVNVLILAAAAHLEMSAARCDSRGKSLHDFLGVRPNQLLLFRFLCDANLLARQYKGHKNGVLPLVREPVSSVHKFLN